MRVIFYIVCLWAGIARLAAIDLYVAPNGSDTNPGTEALPFATIEKARDTVRAKKAKGPVVGPNISIWLREGIYEFTASFELDNRDSGTRDQPVIYSAFRGETVRLCGGKCLPPGLFEGVSEASPVWSKIDGAARGKVVMAQLKRLGVSNYGTLRVRGMKHGGVAPMEVFVNGKVQTLARWPNAGDPEVVVGRVYSKNSFEYEGDRPNRWAAASDVWLHGLWQHNWADFHLPVAAINRDNRTIVVASGPPNYGIKAGQHYFVYNILEELDQPEEYYIDRRAGALYIWPKKPLRSSVVQISVLEAPVIKLNGASHITLRDLILEVSRGDLLRIGGGSSNRIERCTLRNAGQAAAKIDGEDNGLDRCAIYDCGESGVELTGGSRTTLTKARNFVSNSTISRVGRLSWAYFPGISIAGCGQVVTHNLVQDLPHSAVIITGNDHLVEANEVARVCLRTSDAGAIYSGRDWGYRGNRIIGNFVHDIASDASNSLDGANGIYLDDCVSGFEVSGNILMNIENTAVTCGGGADTIIVNNIIIGCRIAHFNGDYACRKINSLPGDSMNLLERLHAEGIQYKREPWASAYPACARIPDSWEEIRDSTWLNPRDCVFERNAGWGNRVWMKESNTAGRGVFSLYKSISNNQEHANPLFGDEVATRSKRPEEVLVPLPGFKAIAFRAIGPEPDREEAAAGNE